jgi:hypothetical protein
MWPLVRLLALAVLAVLVVLATGQGGMLLDGVDAALGLLGLGPWPTDAEAVTSWAALGGLLGGLVLALGAPRPLSQVATLLHELAHTLVSAALGARPSGIVLRHDASGHATARWVQRPGPVHRLSLAATAFVGLPGPAVAAAAGAGLLQAVGPRAVLWATAAAGAIVAALARSAWSLVVAVTVAGLALAGLADAAEPWIAGVVVALLAAVAVHAAIDALRRPLRPIHPGDDAHAVRRRLRVPARLVQVLQVLVTVAAAAQALRLLLPPGGRPPAGWWP